MLLLQVAPEALLDIDVEEEEELAAGAGGGSAGGASAAETQSVQGEIAFLSHEPVVSTAQLKKGKTRAGEEPACMRCCWSAVLWWHGLQVSLSSGVDLVIRPCGSQVQRTTQLVSSYTRSCVQAASACMVTDPC